MAKLTLSGVDYEIPFYKLGALRQAAPILDKIKDSVAASSAENATSMMNEIVAVLAIGLVKLDAKLTAEYLADELVGVADFPEVRRAFFDLMRESGMGSTPGEATAPPAPMAGAE